MELINNSDSSLSDDLKSLIKKVEKECSVSLEGPAVVKEINETGLAIVEVEYTGSIDISEAKLNPVGNPEIHSSTLGDVNLLEFSDSKLKLQIYDRL